MKRLRSVATALLALLGLALWGQGARAADATIKIGYIDPFSGAFAQGGDAAPPVGEQRQLVIAQLGAMGEAVMGLCFMPAGGLAMGDVMLAQKIALETCEAEALAKANRFPPWPSCRGSAALACRA